MKILMLTPYLPYPPSSGGQIRTFNLLKYLSKNNQITLIALYKRNGEKKYLEYLKKYCVEIFACKRAEKPWHIMNLIKTIFSPYPFLIIRNYSKEAKTIIEKILKKKAFDVIHAETFYIMPHLPTTTIPILLVEQTIEYQVYQHFVNSLPILIKPIFYFDILKLKYWERYYWKKASLVANVSKSDKEKILMLEPNINLKIIPNGAGDAMMDIKLKNKDLNKTTLFFIGNFFWLQNVEAAKILINLIYPLIKKTLPFVHVVIAGQNAINKLDNNNEDNLRILNLEPDNISIVKNLYKQATLFIAPIKGPGGTRLKILAAMAAGLPIISTKIGIEGLDLEEGKNILIAEKPEEFVEKIKLILSDKNLYNKIQVNSYNLVRKKYSWQKIAQQLEEVYKHLIIQ